MSAARLEPRPAAGDGSGARREVWRLRLCDRPGSLERVLGVLRRRLVPLEALSLAKSADGDLALELHLRVVPGQGDRVRAELRNQLDVQDLGQEPDWPGHEPDTEAPAGA